MFSLEKNKRSNFNKDIPSKHWVESRLAACRWSVWEKISFTYVVKNEKKMIITKDSVSLFNNDQKDINKIKSQIGLIELRRSET